MSTIIENSEFKVEANQTGTYFVIDNNGTCHKYFKSKLRAMNYFNRISEQAGVKA